jgi:nucleoside-diphosphate-sugar epimerase
MKCLLTGYNGWIAQNLERKLRQYEYSVIGMPRDILYNPSDMEHFLSLNKPAFIIHTAAYGNKFDQKNVEMTIDANILALINLLHMSLNLKYTGFINFSSSSVMLPYETYYSATKAAGERLVRAFVNRYDKPVINVRPFTVIGKGEHSDHLIPKLLESCKTGVEIPFDPEPVHDFIDIEDFCEAIVTLMQYTTQLKGQTIDIGTGVSTTNRAILELAEAVTGGKTAVHVKTGLRPYDTTNWVANPATMKAINWTPKKTIEDSIREMIDS